MQHIVSDSQARLTPPPRPTSPQQCVCLLASVFQLDVCVMGHLQALPVRPKAEGRQNQTVCLEPPAKLQHQAGLTNGCVTGTLPQSWGGSGSFAVLNALEIDCASNPNLTGITGSLPSEWGSSETFQLLQTLSISGCSITG